MLIANWSKIVGWLIALLGLAAGYGKMQATQASQGEDLRTIKRQVNSLYDHLAWGDKGETGPAPPVERAK